MAVGRESCSARSSKLIKSRALKQFLTMLVRAIGRESFIITDHWDADLKAVGIAAPLDPDRLAYVLHTGRGRFSISLELPPEPGSDLPYLNNGTFESLNAGQAIQLIKTHIVRSPT